MDERFDTIMYETVETFEYEFRGIVCTAQLQRDNLTKRMQFRHTGPLFDTNSVVIPNLVFSPSLETMTKALTQTIAMIVEKYVHLDAIYRYALHHSQFSRTSDGRDLLHRYACRALRNISSFSMDDPADPDCQTIPLYAEDPKACDEINRMKL